MDACYSQIKHFERWKSVHCQNAFVFVFHYNQLDAHEFSFTPTSKLGMIFTGNFI